MDVFGVSLLDVADLGYVGPRLGPYDLRIPGCMWLCLCCVSYSVAVYVLVGGAKGLCGFWLG